MNYDYFMGMLKKNETRHIRAFSGMKLRISERIPDAFALLLSDIVLILNNNLASLCHANEGIAILGLQPAGGMIASNEPLASKRSLASLEPDYHLCCTLDYITFSLQTGDLPMCWDRTASVIIDFTSGEVMDPEYYLSRVFHGSNLGKLYGKINDAVLELAWKIVKIKQKLLPSKMEEIELLQALPA